MPLCACLEGVATHLSPTRVLFISREGVSLRGCLPLGLTPLPGLARVKSGAIHHILSFQERCHFW